MDPGTVFALGAALYSSVGHGGASAYIAAMALFSVAPESMKPTALALNLLVAGFGAWRYWSRDLTNWKLVFAFAVTASPAAFVGGGIHLPAIYYKALVGIFAVALGGPSPVAANHSRGSRGTRAILLDQPSSRCGPRPARRPDRDRRRDFPQPLIILNAWEEPRHTSGVVAAFIFLNSAAGLAGNAASVGQLPHELPIFLAAMLSSPA